MSEFSVEIDVIPDEDFTLSKDAQQIRTKLNDRIGKLQAEIDRYRADEQELRATLPADWTPRITERIAAMPERRIYILRTAAALLESIRGEWLPARDRQRVEELERLDAALAAKDAQLVEKLEAMGWINCEDGTAVGVKLRGYAMAHPERRALFIRRDSLFGNMQNCERRRMIAEQIKALHAEMDQLIRTKLRGI